jgi:uncharacterized protein (DUF1778 family)
MPYMKDDTIQVRCETDQKTEIELAAKRLGQSVSSFVLMVSLQAARATMTTANQQEKPHA